jgi:raffinose/stachyose/melibiose transport system permease protein
VSGTREATPRSTGGSDGVTSLLGSTPSRHARPTSRVAARLRRGGTWLIALIWLVVVGAPIYYMVVVSIEPTSEFLATNPWLPSGATLDNYGAVFDSGFARYLLNSVIVAGATTVLAVAVSLLAAYAIVIHTSRATGFVFRAFLIGFAVPIQALIIPLYLELLRLSLYDSLLGLILPMAAFSLPITILVLANFLREVPLSLVDAMRLDGAGPLRILWSLALPISLPAVATVAIFDFVTSWNNFLFPLILTQSPDKATVPLSVFSFQGNHFANVPQIMASVALATAPLLVLYLFARRRLISGLAAGFGS